MAAFDVVDTQISKTTALISSRVRDLSIGVIAFGWSLAYSSAKVTSAGSKISESIQPNLVVPALALAVLALTADFLQHVTLWLYLERYKGIALFKKLSEVEFPKWDIREDMSNKLFIAKIFLMITSVIWIVSIGVIVVFRL